ncbi:A24 family peptidase [Virgibacillus sp. MSP4-1]|uniref:prepilin peptidase n=1 Tax=Virgibacillus sp. MSP4-1 TaxID=2700081 RepID=UPI0003A30F11|nr:A24 family peptidase [Virgibacillus sp. MSP4-1]
MWLIYLYLFILGLILGSFFNVVGLRVPEKQSIVKPRSACPHCHRTLTWKELIPVLSYVWQKGKCSSCSQKISPIYPAIELLSGGLFAFSFYMFGFDPEIIVAFTLISLLLIITVSDLAYMLIPNKVLIIFIILLGFERTFIHLHAWYDPLLGFLTGFLLLLGIALVSKGGMGGGDIKLFAVLGVALGLSNLLVAIFLSSLIGAVVGLIGMAAGKVQRKKPVPFGPFIMAGSLIAYFYGSRLIDWYFGFFLQY